MNLNEMIMQKEGVRALPLAGYPLLKNSGLTAIEVLTDGEKQAKLFIDYIDQYNADMIMLMMDLSVEAEALGLKIDMHEYESPDVKEHPVKSIEDVEKLKKPDASKDGRMNVFAEACKRIKEQRDVAVGAYVASPFTLAGLLQGAEHLAMNTVMDEELCEKTLEFSAEVVKDYMILLEKAGADFIVLLEPTGGLLSPSLFEDFVNPYVDIVAQSVNVPSVLHVCGQTIHLIENMCNTKAQGLSLDSMVDMKEAIAKMPSEKVLIGNVCPVKVMLNMEKDDVYRETFGLLNQMKEHSNFVLSTGCDVPPKASLENIEAFYEAARVFNQV